MLDPRTLRGRLTLAYTAALVVALLAFAALSLLIVDRTQRTLLDTNLATTANSVAAGLEVTHGKIDIELSDVRQFSAIVGARSAAIFDRRGAAIISSSAAIVPSIARLGADRSEPHYALAQAGDERLRAYIAPLRSGTTIIGSIAVWRGLEEITQLDGRLAELFAFAIPLVSGLALLAGTAIARRGLAPLERIASIASEIEGHDLSRRLDMPRSDDELGAFAATFDRMLDRLQHAFARERQFTSDASHELRAPLSVIRAEADLALRRDRSTADYRRALESIATEADALETMTRDLLAVARADSTANAALVPVDLNATVATVRNRLDTLAGARGITIALALCTKATIAANGAELERLVLSLVHNAIKYAPDGGNVSLSTTSDVHGVRLVVQDDGPGFTAAARVHGFERFWRDDAARSRDGTGLGLAIASGLADRFGGTIVLEDAPSGGAMVSVRFPNGAR